MSRPLRLEFEGAMWHVTARGSEKKDIYRDDADRERIPELPGQAVSRYKWRLHDEFLSHF